MDEQFEAIQPNPDENTTEIVRNSIASQLEERERERARNREAYVRSRLKEVEKALTESPYASDEPVNVILQEIYAILDAEAIAESLVKSDVDREVLVRWRWVRRYREQDETPPNPRKEFETYVHAAEALGVQSSYHDQTRYAPVRMDTLDVPGSSSLVREDERTPIGRLRLPKDSTRALKNAAIDINHDDAEHILVIGNPRQGKDSTIASIAGNLKDEHGYKWISVFDDGRNETPMVGLPNEQAVIEEALEKFDQVPKGYETTVFVPDTASLPGELPGNFEPFTIGVDSLSADMIEQLSGVTINSQSTERRIKQALEETRSVNGGVDVLIDRLQEYARETTATVTVSTFEGDEDEESTYYMGEDEILEEVAESLTLIAAEGLIRGPKAETNLDMTEVIEANESVAVLDTNFVDDSIGFLLTNLWLELVWKARDQNPSFPRVALEIREIKNLAPSKVSDAKYSRIIKSLKQTLFKISSQGGSRRIMMIASTQRLKDLYKSVRANMPLKILLQIDEEKIRSLEAAGYSFRPETKHSLREMPTGWGMFISPATGKEWPINWRPARCALGVGDLNWRDRYGRAAGFRVYRGSSAPDTWINPEGDRIRDENPSLGGWYLTPEDVKEHGSVEAALEARQDDRLNSTLRPVEIETESTDRQMRLESVEEKTEVKRERIRKELPPVLEEWVDRDEEMVDRMVSILETINQEDVGKKSELAKLVGAGERTIYRDLNERNLGVGIEKADDGIYVLNEVGERVLEQNWTRITG